MEILADKSPKSISEIVGNKIQAKKIQELIASKQVRIVLVIGPHGSGKTLIPRLIFDALKLNSFEVHNKESLAHFRTFLENKTILSLLYKADKVVFFDNIDVILGQEKNIYKIISESISLAKKANAVFVITSGYNEEKKLTDTFKTNAEVVKINFPSIRDSFVYLMGLCDELKIPYNDKHLLEVVTKNSGCIRESFLEVYAFPTKNVDSHAKQFRDMNPFAVTKHIYSRPETLSQNSWKNMSDLSIVLYTVYENFPDEFYNNFKARYMPSYIVLNGNFVEAAKIEKFVFAQMDWYYHEMAQLLKYTAVFVQVTNTNKKVSQKDVKYRFSQLLSKTSHMNMMNKKITSELDNDISDEDRLYLADRNSWGNHVYQSTYKKYFEKI
jgi:hypothetical protein